MSAFRWNLTVAALAGEPWPALPALPGRVYRSGDSALTEDELAGITSPTELGLILGITKQAASQRLLRRARAAALIDETADTEGATPD